METEAGIGGTHYKPRNTKELSWQPEKMARATQAFHWRVSPHPPRPRPPPALSPFLRSANIHSILLHVVLHGH